jgi:hypothetical protein
VRQIVIAFIIFLWFFFFPSVDLLIVNVASDRSKSLVSLLGRTDNPLKLKDTIGLQLWRPIVIVICVHQLIQGIGIRQASLPLVMSLCIHHQQQEDRQLERLRGSKAAETLKYLGRLFISQICNGTIILTSKLSIGTILPGRCKY